MLSKEEAQRIASAVNCLRPDWSIASVLGTLRNETLWKHRTYRDLVIALAWVATDSSSQKPTRVLADGPWWQATRPAGELSASAHIGPPSPADCDICGRPPSWRHIDHVYQPRDSSGHGTHKPPELDVLLADTAQQLTASTKEPA